MRSMALMRTAMVLAASALSLVMFQNCSQNPAKFFSPGSGAQQSTGNDARGTGVADTGNGRGYDGMVYRHNLLNGTCTDGLTYDSMIVVRKSQAYLVRENCRNLEVEIAVTVEHDPNTNVLVFNGVPFEPAQEVSVSGMEACSGSLTRDCAPSGVVIDLSGNEYGQYVLHLVRNENPQNTTALYLMDSPGIDCSIYNPSAAWPPLGTEGDCLYKRPAAGGEVITMQQPQPGLYELFIERRLMNAPQESKPAIAISIAGQGTLTVLPMVNYKSVEHLGTIDMASKVFLRGGAIYPCERQSTICQGTYR